MASSWVLCFVFLYSVLFCARAICPDHCDCQHAQHLLCTNRGLRAVPKASAAWGTPGDVLVLSLGGNFISNISAFDLSRFHHVTRLDLQYNRIHTVHPKAFEKLSRLEELYLGNNLLSTISPGTLQPLKKLRILDANSNEINKISPDSFTNLESVIKLRLDGNSIETLQDAVFKGLGNLLYLHLESNSLRHVHENAFTKLEKLRFLNLCDNKQTSLHNVFTFAQLTSLTALLLSGNQIQHVGNRVFQNLRRLSRLSLSNNNISVLEAEALQGLSSLRQLLLDGNQLTDIPACLLDPLERVEELDLSRNRISRVDPEAFSHLRLLKVLKLNDNRLHSLAGGIFMQNPELHRLSLSGNDWTCDCALTGFKDWIRQAHAHGRLLTVFLRCHHPPALAGRYLDYLSSSQLGAPGDAGNGSCAAQPVGGALEVGNVQADQGPPSNADRDKRRKGVTPRARAPPKRPRGGPLKVASPPNRVRGETLDLRPIPGTRDPIAPSPPSAPHPAKRFDLPQEDRERPLLTDACQFNSHYITNVSVDHTSARTAIVRWSVRPHTPPKGGVSLEFRLRYDRFGPAPRFPRFVYVEGGALSITLRELEPDATYLVCVEGVVGGATCAVASRDHCVGVVTQDAGPGPREASGFDLQVVTVVTLAVNALLLLAVGGAWAGRGLRRRIRRRKSAVHVRHMYSTRRPPLRAMATVADAISSDFASYRPRACPPGDEGDLIQFPCDRFLDNSGSSCRDDAMQRFQD